MVPMSSLDAINIDTLTNEELEKVIKHCNMLIERNNIEMGGV